MIIPFLVTFSIAFLLSLILTPAIARLAVRWNLTAVPGGRRTHERLIPKLGSVALFLSFLIAVIAAQFLPVERMDNKEIIRLFGLLAGGMVLIVTGVIDDLRELGPWPQFLAQLLAIAIAISCLIIIEYVNNPLTGAWTPNFPYWFTILFTTVWLMGMANTVNWLDGLDGLSAGVTAVASAVLFINAAFRLNPPQTSVSLLPLALLGATLGFLPFNFYPARIFIGGGAIWLGFTLGSLSIIGGAKMAAVLLVMGGPILDVAWQIVSRIRQGKSPTSGDRGHLHFRLQDMGISQRKIVLIYYAFCGFFGILTLLVSSQLFKLLALGVLALFVIGVMIWLSNTSKRKDRLD
ncbi:MAG: undecaprenyl/decaprenyl-phosphate alpha-N-acetylglucosaminyl 1-phosphate transferase [Anaerolineales bacterium]|nr:undecaprenyl/decaprenyl-phosphate alpha-N-acetylglucosaminyl 1-phosphate transferase [Anaerolineales bacterium]